MDKQLLTEINNVYRQLELKHSELINALFHRMFVLESDWYSGYYYKEENGNWFRGFYPIPLITVKGFCDIEIYFDKIVVSTKLKRNTLLAYSFAKFTRYEFAVYSVDDYFDELYHSGQDISVLKDKVGACDDKEFRFSFVFPFDVEKNKVFEFVKLLRREGFYY